MRTHLPCPTLAPRGGRRAASPKGHHAGAGCCRRRCRAASWLAGRAGSASSCSCAGRGGPGDVGGTKCSRGACRLLPIRGVEDSVSIAEQSIPLRRRKFSEWRQHVPQVHRATCAGTESTPKVTSLGLFFACCLFEFPDNSDFHFRRHSETCVQPQDILKPACSQQSKCNVDPIIAPWTRKNHDSPRGMSVAPQSRCGTQGSWSSLGRCSTRCPKTSAAQP